MPDDSGASSGQAASARLLGAGRHSIHGRMDLPARSADGVTILI